MGRSSIYLVRRNGLNDGNVCSLPLFDALCYLPVLLSLVTVNVLKKFLDRNVIEYLGLGNKYKGLHTYTYYRKTIENRGYLDNNLGDNA